MLPLVYINYFVIAQWYLLKEHLTINIEKKELIIQGLLIMPNSILKIS